MFELPKIRIEVESMRYQIVHAFAMHNDEIEKAVEKELQRVIENYPFGEEVARVAGDIMSRAIKSSLEDFLLYGEGRKVLSEAVDNLLTKKLSIPGKDDVQPE